MSAVAIGSRTQTPRSRGASMGRLTLVELRKTVDTRAGLWLLLAMTLLGLAAAVVRAFVGDAGDQSFAEMFGMSAIPFAVLLPVVGILAVTGEWSQRSALTTFALVPQRGRIVTAKVAAGAAIGVASVAVSLVIALVATGVSGAPGGWDMNVNAVLYLVVAQVLGVVGGVAFGMLFLSTPVAIVASFALPTVWGIVAELVKSLNDAALWLDTSRTFEPLNQSGSLDGTEWARVVASAAVWMLLPLAVGAWRMMHKEVA